ncbi:MAG TPA: TolC family protein [Terriglobales bacterium]|nr:TolC family protein [Terriglobales bacterium]
MNFMYRICFGLLLAITALPVARAQSPDADSAPPLLTLDEAVRIATGNNRDIHISELNVIKARETVAQTRTNYFPKLDTNVLAGVPLQPLNFTVPAGSFGTYPATGPIPATNSSIRSPVRIGAFIDASAAQPLTQLYKVKLAVEQARLGTDLAREGVRGQEQEITRQVKDAYYQLAQLQTQVESAKATVHALMALSTVMEQRLSAQTVLVSDSLTVKARLKQQRYQLLVLQNDSEVQKQSLNHLLGRDLRTQFTVEMQPAQDTAESDLEIARKQALEQRPELREARLQTKSAQLEVRRERAEYIPDLSLSVNYLSFQNVNFLPQNAGSAGFSLKWQPFDWGYKKHRIRELKAATEQTVLTEQDAEQRVLLDVDDKFRKLGEARMLMEAETDAREAAQVKLREVTDRFTQQSALLPDLLQQQSVATQSDAQYQQALAGFWTARAEFEKAIGAN